MTLGRAAGRPTPAALVAVRREGSPAEGELAGELAGERPPAGGDGELPGDRRELGEHHADFLMQGICFTSSREGDRGGGYPDSRNNRDLSCSGLPGEGPRGERACREVGWWKLAPGQER